MKKQQVIKLSLFLAAILLLSSCANNEIIEECLSENTYGFWWGLWHGFIAPFDLIAMIFRDDIIVYAPNNNGIWYAFGFVLGSGGWGFMGGKSARKKK
jgi:hypothetical protein